MDQLLDRILARPSLQTAHLVGAAARGQYQRAPQETLAELGAWSDHPNAWVRIASGVGYGLVGSRRRGDLPRVLPYVERLAADTDTQVREHGAEAALESLWMAHNDAVTLAVEAWIADSSDPVREVVARTIARIAVNGKIGRPSVLRRFIERGMDLLGSMTPHATPQLLHTMSISVSDLGQLAPELVLPHVERWAASEQRYDLKLVLQVLHTPFGELCDAVDVVEVRQRLSRMRGDVQLKAAEHVRQRDGEVTYHPVVGHHLLVRQDSAILPWRHIADAYRGCQMRCEFCNSRIASEWSGNDASTFVRRITVVQNAGTLLATELGSGEYEPRHENAICIGVTSDPYQPADERFQQTRELLKTCLSLQHPVIVQTRQELVLRDLDVYEKLAEQDLVNVLVGMHTSIEGVRNKLEPGSGTISERIRTIRQLAAANVPVGLLLSPIMPGLTDDESMLDELIRRAGDAGASWVVAEVLNLHGSARSKVRLLLEDYVATLLPKYKEMYTAGARVGDPDPEYERRMLDEVVPAIAERHGVTNTDRMITGVQSVTDCLTRRA